MLNWICRGTSTSVSLVSSYRSYAELSVYGVDVVPRSWLKHDIGLIAAYSITEADYNTAFSAIIPPTSTMDVVAELFNCARYQSLTVTDKILL